ncbi:MAG: hypothetical protein ACTSV3_03355 [Candidatus Thorarchaeota archaeon]|nr:MAG: hypothetical protein DRO87_02530 [Candidatus Thorarchaeota archaeon]
MSDDVNDRLRDKTMQIVSLNQRVEALQAQLSGSQRRCAQFTERISELETALEEKNNEIQLLTSELSRAKGALDSMGREMQEIRAQQSQQMGKRQSEPDESVKGELELAQMTIERLREDLKKFSAAANSVVNGEEGSVESLRQILLEIGDPKFRILNLVLSQKTARVDEIASTFLMDVSRVNQIVDALQAAGEVEIQDGSTIIPARKYRETAVPKEEWAKLEPLDVFARLEEFVGKTDDNTTLANAIETVVEILEQKLARSGALMFQMRKTADAWRKQSQNVEELHYTVREWRARAQALG